MSILLLATENGQVVRLNTDTYQHQVVFHSSDDEALMGICVHKEYLFVASLSRIYRLRLADFSLCEQTELYQPSPDFHQMDFHRGKLYVTVTKRNQIWVYDELLKKIEEINIEPPYPQKKVRYKKNYNHINNIVNHQGKFYINLNWLTNLQYADSGVLVTDEQFNALEKFTYGWEAHDFQFIDGKPVTICASSSKRKKIFHPYQSGLMVDGVLVFEHDADEAFCKGLCYDDDFIYLCGGTKATRSERKKSNGIIYVLERETYELSMKIMPDSLMAVKGALVI